MGGGLPPEYANTEMRVLESVFNRIKEFKEWLNSLDIKMIIEPGRFIAAPAGRLVTHVIGVYDNNIVVDASVYNTNMDALIVGVKLLIEGEVNKKEGEAYSVKGCTPCSMDLFRYRVYLKDVKVGDDGGGIASEPEKQYIVSVECKSEESMADLYQELKDRGFTCALMT